jgi:hypothetical protein
MQEGGCVKYRTAEKKPATVPQGAKQAGENRASWPWVEPEVWTDRMLTALEKGVKGGKWFSLIDKVYSPVTLGAWMRISSAYQRSFNPGRISPGLFDVNTFPSPGPKRSGH